MKFNLDVKNYTLVEQWRTFWNCGASDVYVEGQPGYRPIEKPLLPCFVS